MTTLARNWPKTALGLGFVSSRSLLLLLSMSEFEETTAWRRGYPGGSEGILPGRLLKFSEFYSVRAVTGKLGKRKMISMYLPVIYHLCIDIYCLTLRLHRTWVQFWLCCNCVNSCCVILIFQGFWPSFLTLCKLDDPQAVVFLQRI